MIWIGRKRYSDNHYAAKIAEIRRNVQQSTWNMVLVAGISVLMLIMADASSIYFM
ncbi:hypothetical protein [Pseudodesulfovibrio sediminis]|uniref:Uncharacterized protein n=1 Tax=Pseudodesulfovibrio sediminis TaxID=2810563 RepID=A0ABN6EUQ7_9BACT|nr:hypothetical protein [Pseudodesulfovibrio sediminis]BCS88999.1 hypothetical protein PSDVSF_22410 [Pseudodesulfovibrio sediminis]